MPDESRWANSEHVFSRPETIDIVRDRWHYSDDFGGFRAASKVWIFQVLAFGVWKIAMGHHPELLNPIGWFGICHI